jgi:hypothetical protein
MFQELFVPSTGYRYYGTVLFNYSEIHDLFRLKYCPQVCYIELGATELHFYNILLKEPAKLCYIGEVTLVCVQGSHRVKC